MGRRRRGGGFRVELVEAKTLQPFKEHKKGTKCYVEVEPDAEYFIRIERVVRHNNKNRMVYMNYEVDGEELGYYSTSELDGDRPELYGSYSRKDGMTTNTALRFVVPQIQSSGPVSKGGRMTGKVTVRFHKAIAVGMGCDDEDYTGNSPSCVIDAAFPGASKAVRSNLGSESQSFEQSGYSMDYIPGKHLETITLYYATALGLIHVGILPKPPLWDQARMAHPSDGNNIDPELANIVPIRIQNDAVAAHGVTASQMQWELFDLTHL